MTTALWWVRRDLRLSDNQALAAALAYADRVVPVFIFDPVLLASPSSSTSRLAFLLGGLRQLDADLRARGSYLVLRRGDPAHELKALLTEIGADAIFAEEDISPYARRRDARVAQCLPLRLVSGLTMHPPALVLNANGQPHTVFTPFSRTWLALPAPQASEVLSAPRRIESPPGLPSLPLPTKPALPSTVPFLPGEAEAQRRLSAFINGPIYHYAALRNRLDVTGSSQLSPYLRFGMISVRQAVVAALAASNAAPSAEARGGAQAWLNELIWREFYMAILYHFPYVRYRSFRTHLRGMRWENNEAAFAAWCAGRTGYPVVDAAMRQLAQIGWIGNRARMIVASFLVKHLLLHWRWGERWFMQHLVDGDPAANNGGWQWTAGTGANAAPYFRIFNPILQARKFDPDGLYVRRWLPELSRVPQPFIHEPWRMPLDDQRACGCIIGRDYPYPIVAHEQARHRALSLYQASRKGMTL